jgi:hypothetical protein
MNTPVPTTGFRVTNHFVERLARRGLREDVLRLILWYGVEVRSRGASFLTVVERSLPPEWRGTELARRARDWLVVFDDEGRLRTCYRHVRATRFLRRRKPRNPTARELPIAA